LKQHQDWSVIEVIGLPLADQRATLTALIRRLHQWMKLHPASDKECADVLVPAPTVSTQNKVKGCCKQLQLQVFGAFSNASF
tara:strand:- start:1070 stop:1315 length:246 start_codon:yes stop_codon:yes gene_type:complete